MNKKSITTIVIIWLGWFILLYGFQWLVTMRFGVVRPDRAVVWSAPLTTASAKNRSVYLMDPFMNNQVAWDSEYYLGIAVGGYDDPKGGSETNPRTGIATPRNYSFFPFYPYAIKGLAYPLRIFQLDPIATATLAGAILTLLGTLAGMLALYDLTRAYFDEDGSLRAIFYLLIFPSAFFLAQIYTEGLFVGLAFWSLALMKRKQWLWASILGVLAALTRAHGAALALPLALAWWDSMDRSNWRANFNWKWAAQGLCALLPVAAYLVWRNSSLGQGWAALQEFYFGRGFLRIDASLGSWQSAFEYAKTNNPATIYFGIEVFTVLVAIICSLAVLRRDLPLALFSLAVVIFSVFSGSAQSMARYVLVAPAIYVALSFLGKKVAFDRVWTLASLLLMALGAALYTFKFWVG